MTPSSLLCLPPPGLWVGLRSSSHHIPVSGSSVGIDILPFWETSQQGYCPGTLWSKLGYMVTLTTWWLGKNSLSDWLKIMGDITKKEGKMDVWLQIAVMLLGRVYNRVETVHRSWISQVWKTPVLPKPDASERKLLAVCDSGYLGSCFFEKPWVSTFCALAFIKIKCTHQAFLLLMLFIHCVS